MQHPAPELDHGRDIRAELAAAISARNEADTRAAAADVARRADVALSEARDEVALAEGRAARG